MFFAAGIAVLAVALGLGLGLLPIARTRVSGPLRTFALSAVLTVVLFHLLPEAFSELGIAALLLFAATSVFPAWFRLVRGLSGARDDAAHGGLVAGYVGLLVHHVGDGLGLGAYAALPGGATDHADVMLALAAHTVPLVAVVAFAFQRKGGSRRALLAASGLAGASVLGVFLSAVVPAARVEQYAAWVAALVAGLLFHVVTHDLGRDLPATFGGRALDALAAAAGVATSLVGGEHGSGNHPSVFVATAGEVLGTLAPAVLAALVLAALLLRVKNVPFRSNFEAAFGTTLAVDGVVLAIWLGGPGFGVAYALGVLVVTRAVAASSPKTPEDQPVPAAQPFMLHLDDFIGESLPWLAAALAFSVLVASSFPYRALDALSPFVALVLALVAALPVRVPPLAAMVVALALERGGLRLEAVLVFALLAPAPGAADLAKLAHATSRRAALRLVTSVAIAVLVLGAAVWLAQDAFGTLWAPPFPSVTSRLAFLLLATLCVRAAFERGVRGLLLRVFPSHDTAEHADESPSSRPVMLGERRNTLSER